MEIAVVARTVALIQNALVIEAAKAVTALINNKKLAAKTANFSFS